MLTRMTIKIGSVRQNLLVRSRLLCYDIGGKDDWCAVSPWGELQQRQSAFTVYNLSQYSLGSIRPGRGRNTGYYYAHFRLGVRFFISTPVAQRVKRFLGSERRAK